MTSTLPQDVLLLVCDGTRAVKGLGRWCLYPYFNSMVVHGIHEWILEHIKLLTRLPVLGGLKQACARPVLKLSHMYTNV